MAPNMLIYTYQKYMICRGLRNELFLAPKVLIWLLNSLLFTIDPFTLQYLLLTPAFCVTTDFWKLPYLLTPDLLFTTESWMLCYIVLTSSALLTTDLCYLLLTFEYCVTPDPWTLCYILLTSKCWVTYCWPLNSTLLATDPCTLCYFLLLTPELFRPSLHFFDLTSCHHPSWLTAIPKSQFLHIKRNCKNVSYYSSLHFNGPCFGYFKKKTKA